ncbi:MAG: hypothetical protein LRZ85_09730 [Alphaproteobacteria bacterium]|nr:hypothetical protein [Alphaproteobacteria bacterium]MCD8570872.1 hypothetical protein [Alphaproteobacteria bacterium]
MEILKVKLQIVLGLIICVLAYKYIVNPPSKAEPEVTMEMIQQQAASGNINGNAKAAADQMMATGDLGDFQEQLNASGMLDN